MRFPDSPSTRLVTRRRAIPAFLLAAGVVIAACGGGDSKGGDTTSAPSTSADTTVPETTEAPTTTEEATTTTEAPAPAWPLTGLPLDDPAAANHPAVVVKVGNYDKHPQRGSANADIIYEEIINANVSRFAFVFHSKSAPEVGPIRSGRRQDVNLFGSLNKPVFAWAGGNKTVTGEVQNSDLVDLSQFKCKGSCYRSGDDKPVEFTLMFNVDKVFAMTFENAGIPQPQFAYRAVDAATPGTPSAGVKLSMEAYKVDWTWNAATGQYDRAQNGRPDKDRDGTLLTTTNVVVLEMVYKPGISGSPDAVSVGKGEAWVFTGGNVVHGTWTRADRLQPFTLTGDDGTAIQLMPGRTFIELPRDGNTVPK
jgi:hypothetical protein